MYPSGTFPQDGCRGSEKTGGIKTQKKKKKKEHLNPVFTVYLIRPDERAHRGRLLLEGTRRTADTNVGTRP